MRSRKEGKLRRERRGQDLPMMPMTRFQTSLARFFRDSESSTEEKGGETSGWSEESEGRKEVELTFPIEPRFRVAPRSKSLSTRKKDDEERESFRRLSKEIVLLEGEAEAKGERRRKSALSLPSRLSMSLSFRLL